MYVETAAAKGFELKGYPVGVLPVAAASKSDTLYSAKQFGRRRAVTNRRTTLPVIPAKAVTVNAVQGDTLEQAVMHISKPPDGKLDSNAPCTAFTRVRGGSHLGLMAPVILELITWPQHADEQAESRRLAVEAAGTTQTFDAGGLIGAAQTANREEAAAQNLRAMLRDTQ